MEVVVLLMPAVIVVVEVVALAVQMRPGEPSNIPFFCAVEVLHVPQRVCAKDDAPLNIMSILVTLNTRHCEISTLNDDAPANMPSMFVTLDTSHLEMSPLKDDA